MTTNEPDPPEGFALKAWHVVTFLLGLAVIWFLAPRLHL